MTDALSPSSPSVAPPAVLTAGDLLTEHLTRQAGAFLRALPLVHGESGSRPGEAGDQSGELLRAVRRVGGALHTFAPVIDPGWAQDLREELRWLLDLLVREPSCSRRLARLLACLDSLTGEQPPAGRPPSGRPAALPGQRPGPDGAGPAGTGMLTAHPGVAKARALLERQLTLARTRLHSAALQELRSARLHALADRMTLLAGEVPLTGAADDPAREVLLPQAAGALRALAGAAELLPLPRAGAPYNGDALHRLRAEAPALDADTALAADDAPWLRVRVLVKRARYALEVCAPLLDGQAVETAGRLAALGAVLDRHQEAADAADTAATAARTPRITPATAYVLGVVHADQRLEVEAARYAFGRQWPELTASGWHQWAGR